MPETTKLSKARKLVQKDFEERGKKCLGEIQQVLDKWEFNLQPAPTKVIMQEFTELISRCGVNLAVKQKRDNGTDNK